MSRKPLLSESQVAKWMKLANIDKNATKNFLSESKTTNKKVLKENYGMNSHMGAREDEDMGDMGMEEDGMGGTEEEGGMEIGDGSMDDQSSVVDDEEMGMDMEAGGDEGEVEFDSVDDLKTVIKDAVKSALEELGLADDMGGDEEPEMDMEEPAEEEDSMEGGVEGGDEPAEPAEDEEQLAEGLENLEILTDNEIINEVLKRVIRRLV
jgi:hypothetical protein